VPADGSPESLLERRTRRVAALAQEIARCLGLSAVDREELEREASRRIRGNLLESKALDRLLTDLVGPDWASRIREGPARAANPSAPASGDSLRLQADILEVSGFFEQRIEFLPYELVTQEQILDELSGLAQEIVVNPVVLTALTSLQRVGMEQLVERVYRLPVFPLIALKALELARSEDADVAEIERLVSSDQVLAGRLVQAANSNLYSPACRISSLRQAVSYIGLETARRLLMGAVFQPLFASAGLKGLWRHSLEISEQAERLAEVSGRVAPEEVFLAGLVHDVGRLALLTASGEGVIAYARMLERGCEPVFAEMVLCGFDHGAAGAGVLRFWSFPEHLAQGVQDHHHPEHSESELAAILYLAEFWSGSEEDLPSAARLRGALERAGVTWETLVSIPAPQPSGLADLLASAA